MFFLLNKGESHKSIRPDISPQCEAQWFDKKSSIVCNNIIRGSRHGSETRSARGTGVCDHAPYIVIGAAVATQCAPTLIVDGDTFSSNGSSSFG